jgi:hypothetical protein
VGGRIHFPIHAHGCIDQNPWPIHGIILLVIIQNQNKRIVRERLRIAKDRGVGRELRKQKTKKRNKKQIKKNKKIPGRRKKRNTLNVKK